MYINLFCSEFYQTTMFEASVSKSAKSEESSGFDSFLRKYQKGEFEFLKSSSSEDLSKINDLSNITDPNEKIISRLVDHMKEVLRNISEGSSMVSFSITEISSIRQILVSSDNMSMNEIDNILNSNSGSYLPDVLSSLENLENQQIKTENVYFPFSLIPYFATALESIGVKSIDITQTIESSTDIEKGFSLKGFLENLDRIKNESIGIIENFNESNEGGKADFLKYEINDSIIKGIETIQSVFDLSESKDSLINLDKSSLDKFVAAMEKRLNSKISDLELYKKSIESSSHEKESDFVKTLLNVKTNTDNTSALTGINFSNEDFSKQIFEQSFLSWKRNERLLSEINSDIVKSDFQQNFFENSHEYSLFTKLSSADPLSETVININNTGLGSSLNEIIQASVKSDKFDFDLEGLNSEDDDNNITSLLKTNIKNLRKEFARDFSEEGSDFMDKSSSRSAGEVSKRAQAGSGANLSKQIMEQIEKQILRTVKLGEKEVSFRLNPPDLGRLHLKIESVMNGVNIKIIAEKSSTHELMVQQAQEFKNQLQSQGMQVAEVNVELAQNFDQAMARERKNSFENNSRNKDVPEIRGRRGENRAESGSGPVGRRQVLSDNSLDLMV